MKSTFAKAAAAVTLLCGSAAVWAAEACCGDIACCVQHWLCCL